ncbi:hypothetical protein Droror1_Dr00010662 [Drosera rotundifolia]
MDSGTAVRNGEEEVVVPRRRTDQGGVSWCEAEEIRGWNGCAILGQNEDEVFAGLLGESFVGKERDERGGLLFGDEVHCDVCEEGPEFGRLRDYVKWSIWFGVRVCSEDESVLTDEFRITGLETLDMKLLEQLQR